MKRAAQDSDNEDRLQRRAKIDDTDTDGNGDNSVDTHPSVEKPTEEEKAGDTKEADGDTVDSDTPPDDKKPETQDKEEAPLSKDFLAKACDSAAAQKSQPHRKPKNFAERLMRALQNEVGKDAIWWMPNGKAIAIHTRRLRDSEDLLMENFKVKDYSVFIRNCNRWGFRRTVQYQVEQGVITYECSLFDRDNPHLVRHMRMDSDVQDVFVRHRDTEGSDVPFDPKRIGRANYASRGVAAADGETAPAREENESSPQQQQPVMPQNGGMRGMDLRAVGGGFGNHNFMSHHQMTMPHPGMGGFLNNGLLRALPGDQYLHMMAHGGGLAAAAAAASAADPPGSAPQASAPLTSAAEMKAALTKLLTNQSQQANSSDSQQSIKPTSLLGEGTSVDVLLDLILTLSGEYLNHPNATSSPNTESICMAMKLLMIQGEKYKEERLGKNQPQAAVGNRNSDNILDTLRSQLNRGSSQAHQGMADRVHQADQLLQTSQLIGSPGLSRGEEESLADQLRKQQLERMLATSRDHGMSPQAIGQLAQSMGIAPPSANGESINQLMQFLQQGNVAGR